MRLNVGKMLTCLAKISLPACGRRCVLELKKAVLGGQSGVQAVLRALRRFSSDFWAFLVVFPRFSPDIGRRCAGSLVRGSPGAAPRRLNMLETCWMLITIRNVASTCSTFCLLLSGNCLLCRVSVCVDLYPILSGRYGCAESRPPLRAEGLTGWDCSVAPLTPLRSQPASPFFLISV